MLTINDKDFSRLVQFVHSNYGIDLSKKRSLITGRLSNTLISMEGGPVRNLEDSQVKIQYLIYKSLIHGGTKYAEMLYRKLTASQDARQAEVLLVTARVYYQENGSVQKASQRLHLHKNTLLYRMKRLFQLLDLENETPFTREFLIRLIFMYHPVDDIT